eukprot:411425-Prorocentrum_lima.AAC.1
MDEGTYYEGQGHYILDVLEIFSSSMHYKTRNTLGKPESFSNNNKQRVAVSKNRSNIKEEQG